MAMTFYVVPALRHFSEGFADFPSRAMAERWVEQRKEAGDDTEFGIYELRLVAGSAKMTFGRTMHIIGERRVITAKHHLGGYSAHDDGLGEDGSPYGHGDTPEAAIADLLEILPEQNLAA